MTASNGGSVPVGTIDGDTLHWTDAEGVPHSGPFVQKRVQILDACCGGRHWWWDKAHPLAIYMDSRVAERGCVDVRPNFEVRPDVVGDFRAMPFGDAAFQLVVFDPPHNVRDDPNNGYVGLKYGALPAETEQDDLRRGFAECWRVLAPGGTLVFKWAGALKRVEPLFPSTPIVGTRTPRGGQTRWFIFYKPLVDAEQRRIEAFDREFVPFCDTEGL